jgi:hypothetical protein
VAVFFFDEANMNSDSSPSCYFSSFPSTAPRLHLHACHRLSLLL